MMGLSFHIDAWVKIVVETTSNICVRVLFDMLNSSSHTHDEIMTPFTNQNS